MGINLTKKISICWFENKQDLNDKLLSHSCLKLKKRVFAHLQSFPCKFPVPPHTMPGRAAGVGKDPWKPINAGEGCGGAGAGSLKQWPS